MTLAGAFDPASIKEVNFGKDKGIKTYSPKEREKVLQTSGDSLSPELNKLRDEMAEQARSLTDSQRAPEDYLALANEAYTEKKYVDVIAFSLAGLQLAPRDTKIKSTLIYRMGTGFSSLDEVSLAKRLYQEGIKEDSENPFPHNGLGFTYVNQGNKWEEAEQEFLKAIALDSNYSMAHNNLGLVYLKQGKLKEAEQKCLKAIALDSNYSMPHSNLGLVYAKQGKLKEAEQEYLKAIELDPNDARPKKNLELLRERVRNGG
jgi:Flp pilus assembly protein TadD